MFTSPRYKLHKTTENKWVLKCWLPLFQLAPRTGMEHDITISFCENLHFA